MKNFVLALLMGLAAAPLWAQTTATAAGADLDAERARLAEERKAISSRYDADRAICYKKFAVEGCLQESRQRRRVATAAQRPVHEHFARGRREPLDGFGEQHGLVIFVGARFQCSAPRL